MATATRKASKPVPQPPLYLRIGMLETDGEENCTDIGPYFVPNVENLRILTECVELLEERRKDCCAPKPVVRIVPREKQEIIEKFALPNNKLEAFVLLNYCKDE